jgi:hypothetical protein
MRWDVMSYSGVWCVVLTHMVWWGVSVRGAW